MPKQWGHLDALTFLRNGDDAFRRADEAIKSGKFRLRLTTVKMLAPIVAPGQVICVANNYAYHPQIEEDGEQAGRSGDSEGMGLQDGHSENGSAHQPQSLSGSERETPANSHPQSPHSAPKRAGSLQYKSLKRMESKEKNVKSNMLDSRPNSSRSETLSASSQSPENSDADSPRRGRPVELQARWPKSSHAMCQSPVLSCIAP